jgi:hypothetical protein
MGFGRIFFIAVGQREELLKISSVEILVGIFLNQSLNSYFLDRNYLKNNFSK